MKFNTAITPAAVFLLLGTGAHLFGQHEEQGKPEKPAAKAEPQQRQPQQHAQQQEQRAQPAKQQAPKPVAQAPHREQPAQQRAQQEQHAQPATQQAAKRQEQAAPQREQPVQQHAQQAKPLAQPQQERKQPAQRAQQPKPQVPPSEQRQGQQPRVQQARQQPTPNQQPARQSYAPPQRTRQQAQTWQQQSSWRQDGAWQGHASWQDNRSSNWQSDHRTWAQRGGYGGYYIPQAAFGLHFGVGNWFRIQSEPVIVGGYPRFQYGGYSFMMVDPWPGNWAANWYSADDVYVAYDNGYYLYNRAYPGEGIAITVVL